VVLHVLGGQHEDVFVHQGGTEVVDVDRTLDGLDGSHGVSPLARQADFVSPTPPPRGQGAISGGCVSRGRQASPSHAPPRGQGRSRAARVWLTLTYARILETFPVCV